MHFDKQGKPPMLQAFDDRAFPRRACQIDGGALQPPNQLTQFPLATWPRQSCMPHVVFEINIVVLHPLRNGIFIEWILQALIPGRSKIAVIAKIMHHLPQKFAGRALGQAKLQQPAHMIGRGARFRHDPSGIQSIEAS